MGTKIDDSVKYLTAMRKTYQADSGHLSVAIDTMHKYQKIEQLIADYEEYKWERIDVKDIREIIDGNDR